MRYTRRMAEKATSRHRLMSVEEYLERERDGQVRHEYVGGLAYAMTGGSGRHNRISGKIYRRLSDVADGVECGPCRTYVSDMKVRIPDGPFYYPDVMVACGSEPEHPYYYEDPCLIVEVLSPKTESIDRREKLEAYKKIPTLRAYLMVSQSERKVERHWKDDQGEWRRGELAGEGSVPVPCPPNTELSLADIYRGT